MIITSGRDLIRYIQKNKLEDCPVGVGCEGYSNDPKDLDTDISVDLTYDGRLLIHDNSYYDELERGEIEGSTMRKFTKYPQGYIKASYGDDSVTTEYAVEIYLRDADSPRGSKFWEQIDVHSTYESAKQYCLANPLPDSDEFYVIRAIDYDAEEGFEVSSEIVEEID